MERSLEVVVAFIGDPDEPFERIAPEDEWNRPYADRPKVTLQVAESESLASVLERAAVQMGLAPSQESHATRFSAGYNSVAFFRTEDERGFASRHVPRFLLSQLTLVDKHGRALFGVSDLRAVRYGDLLRAAEAGVLGGDPLRPYLIIEPPYGDWIGPDWPTLLDGLKVSWEVLEHVATAGGAVAAVQLVRDEIQKRLRRGRDAIEANPEWTQHRTMPYQFVALLRSRSWRVPEIASLLDCSESDAEAVLFLLGFSFDDRRGEWEYRGDGAAEVMTDILSEIQTAAHAYEGMDAQLVRRLVHYIERGKPRPVNDAEDDDDRFDDRPTAGDRIADFGDRLGELVDRATEAVRAARQSWRSRT